MYTADLFQGYVNKIQTLIHYAAMAEGVIALVSLDAFSYKYLRYESVA